MARLQGALDNDIHIACQKFVREGVQLDVQDLYAALQKSNSALKRKPKKVLLQSLERVLEFMQPGPDRQSSDSEAQADAQQAKADSSAAELMNRSLRANLSSGPHTAPASPLRDGQTGDDAAVPDTKRRRMANGQPIPKRQKADRSSYDAPKDLSLDDIGGMDQTIMQMTELIVHPLLAPQKYHQYRVKIPNGILLHGPPGCGKTMLSRAFAAEMNLPFVEILGPSIVSGMSGESEKAIRDRFDEAKKLAPCLVFMDEIDAIAPKRESSQSQMEKRIVAQLLVCMDDLQRDLSQPVMVLATTNRPDSLDPALRRGGRFDTEINIGVPNEEMRQHILEAQTRETPLAHDVDFRKLGKMTAGFVGADLLDFVSKAGSWQLRKYFKAAKEQMAQLSSDMELDGQTSTPRASTHVKQTIERLRRTDIEEPPGFSKPEITMEAFLAVLPSITPSSKREGFATIPDVSWDDVGALQSVRESLEKAIVRPIQDPDLYKRMGISVPAGVLLWGPPGCGKTLLAKAVAAESKANFISIKGPELLNKFVGESEASVRRVFARARSSVPCVIFFDELDALVPRRDGEGSEASARVVNTLLTELDGLNERAGIYIVGATNRVDMIDDAMMRPGRLESLLFVDLPGPSERSEILSALLKGKPVVDVPEIQRIVQSDACQGFSGADVGALVRQAAQVAIGRRSAEMLPQDFEEATRSARASVGDMKAYYKQRERFARRGGL